MRGKNVATQGSSAGAGTRLHRSPADVAYRRAWWSLALYPISGIAAFGIGEGVISLLTDDAGDASFWQVLVAGTPALLVFVIPGILAVAQGRRAIRLGRHDGNAPALVGATIGFGVVGINVLSYVVGLIFG